MDYDLADFKASHLGIQVGAILACPANQALMIEFSQQGRPAIQAIGKALLRLEDNVSSADVKHFIARWVRAENGCQDFSLRGWPGSQPVIFFQPVFSTLARHRRDLRYLGLSVIATTENVFNAGAGNFAKLLTAWSYRHLLYEREAQ